MTVAVMDLRPVSHILCQRECVFNSFLIIKQFEATLLSFGSVLCRVMIFGNYINISIS